MMLICGIFLLVMGIVMMVSPVTFYNLTESWKNSSLDEPSGLYKFSTRFGGVAFTIAGIAGIVVFFVK